MELLVRNKVRDFDHWKGVFDQQSEAGLAAGMKLARMWRTADDPNNVFFILEVEDRKRAEDYMHAPESAEVGRKAGVIDGEYYFLDSGIQ